MSQPRLDTKRQIVFVCPQPQGESLRGARAVASLDNVRLLGIFERLPAPADAEVFEEVIRVDDTHDPNQLLDGAKQLVARQGTLERIVTVHETLLSAVAQTNVALGLPGLRVSTVRRVLDKSLLKQVLRDAGIETARDRVINDRSQAQQFVEEVGFPVVLKPLGGSGGLATWRVFDDEHLERALDLLNPVPANAVLLENHLQGHELCIDTITIDGEPQFHSICRYEPNILEALEDDRIQWRCVMPRDIAADAYRDFIERGLAATRALSVGNAMTHMEGFMLEDGRVAFTDATLRPAGARIAPMLAFAYDIDPYRAWARVAVDGCFDGPWQRKYAVGTIFLRGTGQGRVERIDGLQSVQDGLAKLSVELVDSRLPRVGKAKSATYTGDGFVTVRHPETKVVEDALDWIDRKVVVHYDQIRAPDPQTIDERWTQRLSDLNRQAYKPAWDEDTVDTLTGEST